MPDVIARLLDHWNRTEVGARPGVSPAELAAFEARHGVRLPPAMAALYRGANGIESDNHLLSIWPLADVGQVPAVVASFNWLPDYGPIVHTLSEAEHYFAFADSMMGSYIYATRLTPDGREAPVLWISGAEFVEMAPSFDALWELYLRDPEAVVYGQAR